MSDQKTDQTNPFRSAPTVPSLDYIVQHIEANDSRSTRHVRVERRPDLAVSPHEDDWPEELHLLSDLCASAYSLFVRLDDYACDHAEAHGMGDSYADWYAHALNAYYRWRDLERDAQAAVAAWERARDADLEAQTRTQTQVQVQTQTQVQTRGTADLSGQVRGGVR